MSATPPEKAWELVLRHRDFYGAYHHQKENAAYTATAFYLGGISALVVGDVWVKWPRQHLAALAAGVLVAAVFTIAFVLWQFHRRLFAVDMVAACTDLTARWVTEPPADSGLRTTELCDRLWPAVLVERFQETSSRGPWWPRELAVIAIFLWTAAAILKIVIVSCA
jgi:hypothetical protein